MKKIIAGFITFILIPFLFVNELKAQSTKLMSYQAVVRNNSGGLVQNSLIGARISILQYTSTGMAVYVETQSDSTNSNGLFGLQIGGGAPVTGAFDAIDWTAGPYFIKTEIDPSGGTNYSLTGVSQLLYVPYTFFADMANTSLDNVWKSSGTAIYSLLGYNAGINNYSPNASLSVGRGTGTDGTAAFFGTSHTSHFNYSTSEHTYIRGGMDNSNVILNDIPGGKVGIAMANPTRAIVEQYGTVGSTAAIFGGDGAGVSLQSNWPAIGLNHYYDGSNSKSIGAGYAAQIFVAQNIGVGGGAIGFTNFPNRSAIPDGNLLSPITKIYLQNGRIGIGTNDPQSDIDIIEDFANTPLPGISWTDNSLSATGRLEFSGNYLRYYWDGNYVAYLNTTGSWSSTSDSTLKRDIHSLSGDYLTKLSDVIPVTYNMRHETPNSCRQYGFISQNIQHVFPELVTETEGIKMLNYQGMIPIAIESIKELHNEVIGLKAENQLLKDRLDRLEGYLLQAQKSSTK